MLQPSTSANNQLVRRSLEAELEIATKSGEIQLQCKNLTEFPRSLGKHFVLADTRIADLSKNKLTEVPEECTYFSSLEKLILYHNAIKSIPDSLGCLQSLQYLDLSRNQLTYIPNSVCQLSQLQSLVVNNNKLVSLPEEIGELTNLMQLDVSCNEIAHLPVQIGDLSNLRSLNLRRNHLQEVPVELTYLQLNTLELSSNRLSNLPVELRFMVTLVELCLEENPLNCPPANMCCRGRVHIFKYLETIAIKEDKKRGILADTEHRRSYRKTSQIGDMRFGAVSADVRLKRHTADSGYGSEQPHNARRWSTELQDGADQHVAEDTRRLAHRAISYRPAANSGGFSGGGMAPPPALSPKPSINVQVAHPSLSSNGSGSSGVSSLSSQGGVSPGGPQGVGPGGQQRLEPNKTPKQSIDVCDSPKWNQQPYSAKPIESNPVRNKFSSQGDTTKRHGNLNGRTNGMVERTEPSVASPAYQPNNGLRIGTGLKTESPKKSDLSLDNLEKKKLNGNNVDPDKTKKSILKTNRANSNSSLAGKLPVPNQITSPRQSPTSPTPSGHSSPNSNKSFGQIPSNPNSSGLPSPVLATGLQTKSSNFQTYRQFKEQQKLSRQTDSAYRSAEVKVQRNNHKTGVEIRSYYERMQSQSTVRAGAPPETSPPPPPSQLKPTTASRTAIPMASRSPSNSSTGSYNRNQSIPRASGQEKSQFTVRREAERAAVQDMHIHHLRQNIEQRLKISLGDDLPGCLSDGVVLCHMANHVAPRSVNSIHVPSPAVPKLSAAKCRRNVDNFISACRKIGVREDLICSATDITEPNSNHTVRVAVTVAELLRYKNI